MIPHSSLLEQTLPPCRRALLGPCIKSSENPDVHWLCVVLPQLPALGHPGSWGVTGAAQQPASLGAAASGWKASEKNRPSSKDSSAHCIYTAELQNNPKNEWTIKALLPVPSVTLRLSAWDTTKLMTGGNKTELLIKIQSYYFPACGTETKQHLSVCHLPVTFEQKYPDSPCLHFHHDGLCAASVGEHREG